MGRQRLQIGANLVANVATAGRPVGAGDTKIDPVVLHQMSASVINDDRVRHAVLAKLPGGQAGTLVAGPGLVNPDVD